MNLVGIAGVVAEHVDRQRQIAAGRFADRLAVVERFQRGQLIEIFFDQVGQLVHQAPPFAGVHLPPGAMIKCLPGRGYGQIDVGGVPLGNLGDDFFGRRVDGLEGLATLGRHPLAADKTLRLVNLRLLDGLGGGGHVECSPNKDLRWSNPELSPRARLAKRGCRD